MILAITRYGCGAFLPPPDRTRPDTRNPPPFPGSGHWKFFCLFFFFWLLLSLARRGADLRVARGVWGEGKGKSIDVGFQKKEAGKSVVIY